MIIKRLIIKENEQIAVSLSFKEGLMAVENKDYILDTVSCVLGEKRAVVLNRDYNFLAEIFMDQVYFVQGEKKKGVEFWNISVSKQNCKENCINEYFEKLRNSPEADSLLCFHHFKKQEYTQRLEQYKNALQYYPNGEFVGLTNGYGTTRSFRAFMAQYIHCFKPIKLNLNKNLFLRLLPSGKFVVTDHKNNEVTALSSSEDLLYHYYSFLSLVDFWDKAESIRNLNRVKCPLVISQFIEFLDDSIDVSEILEKADKIGRQVILFTPQKQNI